MKTIKIRDSLVKFAYLILIAGLTIGLCSSAFGATTNKVSSKPLILIGATGTAGNITVTEVSGSALSGSITLECPAGVTFVSGEDPNAVGTAFFNKGTLNATVNTTKDKATWFIDKSTGAADPNSIILTDIKLALDAATVPDGDVILTLGSAPSAYNPGLTIGDVVVAQAVFADGVAEQDGDPNNVAIGGSFTKISNVKIYETTSGAIAKAGEISIQLPTGVTFDSSDKPTLDLSTGALTVTDPNKVPTFSNADSKISWTVSAESTKASTLTISNIKLKVASSVAVGDINATVNAGKAIVSETLKIAVAAKKGVKATVVTATDTFTTSPTALAASNLPSVLNNRANIDLPSIMVVENFPNDIIASDELVLTLPSGVTFAEAPPVTPSQFKVSTSISDPTSYNTFTIPVDSRTDATVQGGFLIGNTSTKISIDLDSTVPDGDLIATLSGKVAGSTISSISLTLAKVVSAAVTATANTTIPVVGIGGTGSIGDFTIVESSANSLLANSSTITLTLPAGVTWNSTTKPTVSISGTEIIATKTATLSSSNSVATFKVTKASSSAATLTISGKIDLASTVAPGNIDVTIGGTAGASGAGPVTVATAADAVSITATKLPTLTAGVPTQAVGNIVLTEAFKAGLGTDKRFRLLATNASWADAVPTVSVTPTSAISTSAAISTTYDGTVDSSSNTWDYEIKTTYNTDDTLVIRTPNTASTSAATITLSGLKLNPTVNAAAGNFAVQVLNGGTDDKNGAGIKDGQLVIASIGAPAALTFKDPNTPTSQAVAVGKSITIDITGGMQGYTVVSSDINVATTTVSATEVTITGVAAGVATITVTDNSDPVLTLPITVTVVTPKIIGSAPGLVNEVDSTPTDMLDFMLNITNTKNESPAQEWLVFGGVVGGMDIGVFFWTKDSAGTQDLKIFDAAGNPADFTYAFDPAATEINVYTLALGTLGFSSGDVFWYGYAYSVTALSSFVDSTGALDPAIVLENFVNITLK